MNKDNTDNPFGETAETTTEQGLKLLDIVKKVEDKTYVILQIEQSLRHLHHKSLGRVCASDIAHLKAFIVMRFPLAASPTTFLHISAFGRSGIEQ